MSFFMAEFGETQHKKSSQCRTEVSVVTTTKKCRVTTRSFTTRSVTTRRFTCISSSETHGELPQSFVTSGFYLMYMYEDK